MAEDTDKPSGDGPAPDASTQPAELPTLLAPGSKADGSQEGDPGDWQPPQLDERGFAIDGDGLPLNILMRGKVLADRGMDEDPSGAVSPEGIAAAADQLAAYDEQYPKLDGLTVDKLRKQADAEGVALPEDALKDDIRSAIEAARPARI